MIEGVCQKCQAHYYGWALRFPRNQSCPKCGTALDIFENGKLIAQGYSPFTAEKYTINLPPSIPTPSGKTKSRKKKDNNQQS